MDIKSFVLGLQKGKSMGGGSSADVRYVTFIGADGTELYKKAVAVGDDCVDIAAKGLISTPTKEMTVAEVYTYSGWSLTEGGAASSSALTNVTEDRTVYAAFTASARLYAARFLIDDDVISESQVAYRAKATPPTNPTKDGYIFVSWTPSDFTIYEDTDFISNWRVDGSLLVAQSFPTGVITTPANATLTGLQCVYSNDGSRLFASSNTTVYMFDATTQPYTLLHSVDYGSVVQSLEVSPNGNLLAVSGAVAYNSANSITFYEIGENTLTPTTIINGEELAATQYYGLSFTPNGEKIYAVKSTSAGVAIDEFNVVTGEFTRREISHYSLKNGSGYKCSVSPDGTKLAISARNTSYSSMYFIFDIENGFADITTSCISLKYSMGDYVGVAYSPSGKYLVAYSWYRYDKYSLLVWDTSTAPYTLVYSNKDTSGSPSIYDVAFSPDESYLALCRARSSANKYLDVLNTTTWEFCEHPIKEPTGSCYGVAFNNDGSRLAFAQRTEPYVALYKVNK